MENSQTLNATAIPLLAIPSIVSAPSIEPNSAINVRDAYFSYSGCSKTLSDININVFDGSIYALLGPSGCGKTTLLKLINGRLTLDKGCISLFGRPLHQLPIRKRAPLIGFMPQELSQYSQFTIEETVSLYGKLQNMKNSDIQERLQCLIDLLDLPCKNKKVGCLSGGQQRRVSLASALIHSPPLLILDEPTVGVDPLLRQRLWKYLIDLSANQGTTVILTTHYTEEAKTATRVGFMRNGEILVDGTPKEIMRRFRKCTLELCFLEICSQKEDNIRKDYSDENDKIQINSNELALREVQKIDCDVLDSKKQLTRSYWYTSFRKHKEYGTRLKSYNVSLHDYYIKISVILWRNILISKKNFPLLLFQLIIPLLTVTLISISVGTKLLDVPIGLVNEEDPSTFGVIFVDTIDNQTIKLFMYSNIEDGIAAVKKLEVKGLIHIGPEFSRCVYNKLLLGVAVDNHTIECSTIRTYFDLTNGILLPIIQHSIIKSYQLFQSKVLSITGMEVDITAFPIDMSNSTYGYDEEPFSHYVLPAAITSLSFYMPLLANLFTFILERKSGLQDRLRVSGVTFNQILISQFLTQTIIVSLQIPLMLIVPILGFHLPMRGSILLTYVLQVMEGVVGLSFGFLISAITNSENTAIIIVLATLYTNLSLSGFLWPLERIPVILRKIAYFLPITMPNEAQRVIMLKGWSILYPSVYLGFTCTFLWSFIFITLTAIVLKLKNER